MVHDLAVIGAGPAGLAAAGSAAAAGLDVVLIDSAPRPGGQFYRQPPSRFHASRPGALHHGWATFERLRDALDEHIRSGRIAYLAGHAVWHAVPGPPFTLHLADSSARARAVVVAAGAYDRVLPFPGWDLPGVMTAGGVQALLKGNLVVAGKRIVVAGSGPFLLPVATGLLRAGATVAGVYEASRLARHAARFATHPGRIVEGAGYAARLLRHGIPYHGGHGVIEAHAGDGGELATVSVARLDRRWRPVPGTVRTVECDTLAVGYGFTPQLEIALQLGCGTRADSDGSLVVAVDAAQRTNVPGVYAAGETTGVGGAPLAVVEGDLAGRAAARDQGTKAGPPSVQERRLLRRRARLRAFAAELHGAYALQNGWTGWLRDDTLVCRCEEVTRGEIADATGLGAVDPRAVKLITRAGMGWCQGRVCGFATAWLTGRRDAAALEGLARRPFAQPVSLSQLAEAQETEEGS